MAVPEEVSLPVTQGSEDRTPSRRERERLMRRDAILEAALVVFAEKGYRNATLDEIAERAEFGKGTLYNYFPEGKEGLLFAIFDSVTSGIQGIAHAAFYPERLGRVSFRIMLTDFVAQLVGYANAHREMFLVLLKEATRMALGDEPEKVRYFQEHHGRMVALLLPVVEGSMASGELRRVSSHAAVQMILGNVDGYIRNRCHEQALDCSDSPSVFTPLSPSDAAGLITTLLLDGLGADRHVPSGNGATDPAAL